MVYYAVIDTNVFVSALLSKRKDAATVKVVEAMFDGEIVPLYHEEIIAEYDEVLHREKFHFDEELIQMVLLAVRQYGVEVFRNLQEKFWLIWMIWYFMRWRWKSGKMMLIW